MYIYELSFDVNKELCRLLDNDENWKELAGHMNYSAFDINEIEQLSQRQAVSPTGQLFTRWGQLNHRVEELFILLHRMDHIPARNCLQSFVGPRYLRLMNGSRNGVRDRPTANIDGKELCESISCQDKQHNPVLASNQISNCLSNVKNDNFHGENGNRPQALHTSQSSLPIPAIKALEQGLPTSSRIMSHTDHSSVISDTSTTQDSSHGQESEHNASIPLSSMSIPILRYEELKEATGDWSEANILGRGGFGHVFKGEWKLLTVAVKRLTNNDVLNRELIREMLVNQYRHDNILPLYGYSIGGPEACLVYQLMAGGSLEQRLKCKTHYPPLSWVQRHRIAHGVARGLQFLHTMTGTPLIHGDIKPANILLDQCTIPKIGDFGLARKGPYGEDRTHLKVSRVHGTRPYLPDEYLRSRCLSPAVDVFSFGVVLLEMATGLPAMYNSQLLSQSVLDRSRSGEDLATLEDRMISGTQASNRVLCRQFISIGLHCTEYNRHERPSMLEVYKTLDAMNFPGKNTG